MLFYYRPTCLMNINENEVITFKIRFPHSIGRFGIMFIMYSLEMINEEITFKTNMVLWKVCVRGRGL